MPTGEPTMDGFSRGLPTEPVDAFGHLMRKGSSGGEFTA